MTSTDLADDVTSTAEALQKAREELEASRTAVADADASLTAYEARARCGLNVSAATFGDRRAQVELSRMTLEAAEARAETADAAHKLAVSALAAEVVVTDDRLNGSREPEVERRVADLVTEARKVAEDFYIERNAALAEVHGPAVDAGLPRASIPPGTADIVIENPLAPVAVYGTGLLIEGVVVLPVNASARAAEMVAKVVDSLAANR